MATTLSFSRALLRPALRLQNNVASVQLLTSAAGALLPPRLNDRVASRRMVSATAVLLEQRTMKLPGLGDSITEGTIVEWTASVGQAVKEGDVVAMVETDKVTVDIKAEIDGVIVEQFNAVDDTIEVGADLYRIDTEAEASVMSASSVPAAGRTPAAESSKPAAETATTAATSETTQTTSGSSATTTTTTPTTSSGGGGTHRTPSIQFLGRDGWARRRLAGGEQTRTPAPVIIPPMYGRPVFTEEEMEALVTGGANLAPQVKKHSSGAMFG